MKFSDLEKGVIYEDDLGTYKFKRFAGHNVAEFEICEYFEDKGYVGTNKALQFNKQEIQTLKRGT